MKRMKKKLSKGELLNLSELFSSQRISGEMRPAVTLVGVQNKNAVLQLKIALSSAGKPVTEAMQEAIDSLIPERLRDLQKKTDRSDSEQREVDALVEQVNRDYAPFEKALLAETVEIDLPLLDEETFAEWMNANARRFDLNQLEYLYRHIVKRENEQEIESI